MWSIIKWFKGPSTTGDQYVEVSADNPLPVEIIAGGGGGGGGGSMDVSVQNWPTTQAVSGTVGVNNFPTWQGVGNILQGSVAQGAEKVVDLSGEGATAVWIQADPSNTVPLQVSNITGFEGAWIQPGSSEWFYYPKIYIKHSATATQNMAYQAVKYG